MTEIEIKKSLAVCSNGATCDECYYKPCTNCKGELMKDSLRAIEFLSGERRKNAETIKVMQENRENDVRTIHNLQRDIDTWAEMLEQKYTKKQLAQAVNDIFDDTVTEDLNSTGQAVGAFLRLIDADGYMAVLPDGTVEIRLNEE